MHDLRLSGTVRRAGSAAGRVWAGMPSFVREPMQSKYE